uniref:Uncharacterized protein n=1 Tax=Acrobeloides nanus TaxID=290746 RepID=A0A914C033_9BILA
MGASMGAFNAKGVIKETNMDDEMVEFATQTVDQIVESNRTIFSANSSGMQETGIYYYDNQVIIDGINEAFSSKYGGKWICNAGENAMFTESERPSKFIWFESLSYSTGETYKIFIYSGE